MSCCMMYNNNHMEGGVRRRGIRREGELMQTIQLFKELVELISKKTCFAGIDHPSIPSPNKARRETIQFR
jgi:hypothetical protein